MTWNYLLCILLARKTCRTIFICCVAVDSVVSSRLDFKRWWSTVFQVPTGHGHNYWPSYVFTVYKIWSTFLQCLQVVKHSREVADCVCVPNIFSVTVSRFSPLPTNYAQKTPTPPRKSLIIVGSEMLRLWLRWWFPCLVVYKSMCILKWNANSLDVGWCNGDASAFPFLRTWWYLLQVDRSGGIIGETKMHLIVVVLGMWRISSSCSLASRFNMNFQW